MLRAGWRERAGAGAAKARGRERAARKGAVKCMVRVYGMESGDGEEN